MFEFVLLIYIWLCLSQLPKILLYNFILFFMFMKVDLKKLNTTSLSNLYIIVIESQDE